MPHRCFPGRRDQTFIATHVARIEIQPDQLVILISDALKSSYQMSSNERLIVSWQKNPFHLPHGSDVVRLSDLPAEWSQQRQMPGLSPQ
jgi:hypothetical protein